MVLIAPPPVKTLGQLSLTYWPLALGPLFLDVGVKTMGKPHQKRIEPPYKAAQHLISLDGNLFAESAFPDVRTVLTAPEKEIRFLPYVTAVATHQHPIPVLVV